MQTVEGITIPDPWCEMLTKVKQHDPDAIIAGGAIRDLMFGVQPKDIDIFTTTVNFPCPIIESGMDYRGMKYILGVAESEQKDPIYNFLIIEPTPNIDLIMSFDIGLCQIGFDGKQLIKTPAFLWDQKSNIMTLRHLDRYPRSIRRYARINQRYNLDLIIPELEAYNALSSRSS